MKTLLKTLALAVVTAVGLTGVQATNANAAEVALPQDPAKFQEVAQKYADKFAVGGFSTDGNTMYIDRGTVRLTPDAQSLQLVATDGTALLNLPLRGYDSQRNVLYPLTARVAVNGKSVTFEKAKNGVTRTLNAAERQQQNRLRTAIDPNSAFGQYGKLTREAHNRDPLAYYGGGVLGCVAGAAISFVAASALTGIGAVLVYVSFFFLWPLMLVGAAFWVVAIVVAATTLITCPVGWVVGSAAITQLSDDPVVVSTSDRFWDQLFGFNWF
ncbi:MAG TPA: hypothetical protein GX530_00230 [Corynebacteriales bacterium]|nr:hypothetical protein [Mycobacteriales bacterium]